MANDDEIQSVSGIRQRRTTTADQHASTANTGQQATEKSNTESQGNIFQRGLKRMLEPITFTRDGIFKSERSWVEDLLKSKFPNDQEQVNSGLKFYDENAESIRQDVRADMYGKDAFNLELERPDQINEKQLQGFFIRLLDNYSRFTKKSLEADYVKDPKKWVNSKPTRARLVLIEATDENIPQIAQAMLNSSPLERVVAVGMDEGGQETLKQELLNGWKEKINGQSDPEYGQRVGSAMEDEHAIYGLNEDTPLHILIGPHGVIEGSDITFENMQKDLESTFYTKIDEIILYGTSNNLVDELPVLAHKSEAVKYLGIKAAESFEESDSAIWRASLQGIENPMEHITSSKNPHELLKEGKYVINPKVQETVNRNLSDAGLEDNQKAQEFFKNLLASKSLYLNNLSPTLYATTVTKAQSGLNGKGAIVVARSILWGIVGIQKSTAEGARFSINATMFDTGNDMHQEDQEKIDVYAKSFTSMYEVLKRQSGISPDLAFDKAIHEVVKMYEAVETSSTVAQKERFAATQRDLSLVNANKTNKLIELGIKLVNPQVIGFGIGMTGLGAGIAALASSFTFPTALSVVGVSSGVTFATALTAALGVQWAANEKGLARWHRFSARARSTKQVAQDNREKLVTDITKNIVQEINAGLTIEQIDKMHHELYAQQGAKLPTTEEAVRKSLEFRQPPADARQTSTPVEGSSPIDIEVALAETEVQRPAATATTEQVEQPNTDHVVLEIDSETEVQEQGGPSTTERGGPPQGTTDHVVLEIDSETEVQEQGGPSTTEAAPRLADLAAAATPLGEASERTLERSQSDTSSKRERLPTRKLSM